ncbi:MAG: response regulator [Bacteroidia bacterium]
MTIKIIQVDDDYINNLANERLIKKLGISFESHNFLDPSEALDFLAKGENVPDFDLMLLDINMPRFNGWEFLEMYKNHAGKFPIFMLTSSLDPNDQRRAAEHPLLTGFFVKPLTKDMMLEIFDQANLSVLE